MTDTRAVKCPTCSATQQVAVAATGYTCTLCGSEWQWALCAGCARTELALAGQESWKCTRCGRYTRSWWRSTSAVNEAGRIARLRVQHYGDVAQRRQVGPRKRRRRIAMVVLGALSVTAASGMALRLAGGTTPEAHTMAACSGFERARSGIAGGAMDRPQITRAIGDVTREAAKGTHAVADAAAGLAAAGPPGSSAFLVAQTRLTRACDA